MTASKYEDLPVEDNWIDYLRSRLPYSFARVEARDDKGNKHYVLHEPVIRSGRMSGNLHNFWKRGNTFYMTAKVLEYSELGQILNWYRQQVGRRRAESSDQNDVSPMIIYRELFYNSMQLEKVWNSAQDDILNRERVMMTNLMQGIELALKAIATHTHFSENGSFMFRAGHNISRLYNYLPPSLREEITEQSKQFAKEYLSYRSRIEAHFVGSTVDWHRAVKDPVGYVASWEAIASTIENSDYTAFVNVNDPGRSEHLLHDKWLEESLNSMNSLDGFADRTQYYRYAPARDQDQLPPRPISWGLLLGRFLYEHLFPVPLDADSQISTGLQH